MVPLDVAATWTRMLSVTAGAAAAIGAPGPATRVHGKAAHSWIEGPWLGILDFLGVKRCEREVLDPWLSQHGEMLLLVRHLLLAKPLSDEVFIDLTAQAREAMISAPATSWLPKVWSPLAWVLTTVSMLAAAGTDLDIVSSISRVSFRSKRVSIRRDASPSVTRPALLHPQVPSGCR